MKPILLPFDVLLLGEDCVITFIVIMVKILLVQRTKIIFERKWAERISNFATQQGIKFHFIPPCSPHMGGIWEARVKSMKFHLRVAGNAKINYEEFYTLLCQIEAVLNKTYLSFEQ